MSFDFNENRKHQPEISYELWMQAHSDPAQSKTGKFLTLSAVIHAGLFLAIAMLTVPLVEQAKTETITIEIAEPVHHLSRGHAVPRTQGAPPAHKAQPVAKADLSPAGKGDIVVAKAARSAARPAKAARVAVAKTKLAARAKSALKAMSKSSSRHNPVAVAHATKIGPPAAPKLATLDDIDAPEIDQEANEVQHSWTPTAYNDNLDSEMQDIDAKNSQALAKAKNKLDQEADALGAENEAALQAADAATKNEMAALEAANKARRARDGQAIAAAVANENAAREAAARAAAEREAARERAAALAAASRGNGRGHGKGSGSQGSQAAGGPVGVPNGIRSLDQLRQMPGNPVPQYSTQERLKRQQGKVTYYAYVKRDGSLTGFKQVTTTGYTNLDSKTLTALQKWRFYPGQEGWVELPFRWDLKGGAQSVDGLLRTKRSDLSQR